MSTSKDIIIDNKITKRHYAGQNFQEQLQFTFESDPNLCLVKNNIKIHFQIELPEEYLPKNGFAAKQFSGCAVEVNSQRVSYPKSK